MTTKNWNYQEVKPIGVIKTGGSVFTKAGISTSLTHSCKIETCKCIKSFWISVNFGYSKKNKSVSGITFYFNNEMEFDEFSIQVVPNKKLTKSLQTSLH